MSESVVSAGSLRDVMSEALKQIDNMKAMEPMGAGEEEEVRSARFELLAISSSPACWLLTRRL